MTDLKRPIPRAERNRTTPIGEVRVIGEAGSWQELGECFGDNDDSMYPEKQADQKLAAQRCQLLCDVQTQCLDAALTNKERHGVWGGTTERERAKLLRRAETGR